MFLAGMLYINVRFGSLVVNGLSCFVDLLSQTVAFVRGHSLAFVKTWCILVHMVWSGHAVPVVRFPCMLTPEGTFLCPVHLIP